jgi:membrane-associated phospholipid phosphatase
MNEIVIQLSQAENSSLLPEIYRWGIEVIRVIQRIESPPFTTLMKFVTALGSAYFYVPLILFIFWWIDEKQGFRFALLIIVSAWINAFMKEVLKQPRPFNLEPALGLAHESSYGAPSGHAQMSLSFWIPMAAWLNQVWAGKKQRRLIIWISAVFIIFLMGFTRLYLGVHFPSDIIADWILGGIILAFWFIPGSFILKHFASTGIRGQNIVAAGTALVMNGLFPTDRSLPALFLGLCLGYTLMKQRFPFCAGKKINGKIPLLPVRIFRCLAGFTGMAMLFLGLRLILPGEGSLFGYIYFWGQTSPFYEIGRFVRYGLLGFWTSAGTPYMFQRLGLASVPSSTAGTDRES